MIKNFIFDLYGTLIDIQTDESMDSVWIYMSSLLASHGAVYASDELRKAYKSAVENQIEQDAAKHPGVPKKHIEPDILAVFEALYTGKKTKADNAKVRETALMFRRMSTLRIKLYPGALQVLNDLRSRGKKIFLLSNAQSAFTVPEMRMLNMMSLFDGIVLSSDVGVKKPDKTVFDYVLMKYRLHSDECVMIGNDIRDDICGANAADIAGLYIHSEQSSSCHEELPDNCQEIKELTDILCLY